jgi:CRP/FNR family transcriptional regulator, anaerobic regulatory protein
MFNAPLDASATPSRIVCAQQAAAPRASVPLRTPCSSCLVRELCLPCGMTGSDVQRLDSLMFGRRKVKTSQTLYREGDRFQFIYAVRSGTFKAGLDGVAQGRHASSAAALEDTEVCAIPYIHLTELAAGSAGMQQAVNRLMSREIVQKHSLMMLLGSMNAEERLAAFLLNLAQRLKARSYSASDFHLRMSRAEIGSYLGMSLETVSRTFSAFEQQRLLEVDKRHICILDPQGLARTLETRMH